MTRRKSIPVDTPFTDLLVPVFRTGRKVYECPTLSTVRVHAATQLAGFHPGIKRLLNPHQYPVGLESVLHELKTELVLKARGNKT